MSLETIERLQAICGASPDAILLVDSSGNVTFANARVSDLFGYDPEELVGEPIERLVPERHRDSHVEQRDAYLSEPETRPMGAGLSLQARRKDGSTVPVDVSLSPVGSEGDFEVMAAVRDVTDRRALRKKYRTILENAPDAIFVADRETGEITETNQRAADLLGYLQDELVGMSQAELHPSGEAERYETLFRYHIESDEDVISQHPDGSDVHVETSDGDRIPVEISASVFEIGDRRLVTGAFRDVSERRTYQRRLEHEIDRLETLAGILSHDLQSPLGVAEGYIELARESGDDEHLDRVEGAIDRIRSIIDPVLTMIAQGGSMEEASLEPLDLESSARTAWGNVAAPDATLAVDDSATILADPTRIPHLFENLFKNAVEHGGGDVTVALGVLSDGSGFYVEDDGPGIPEGKRASVLEAGFTTSDRGSGFGLGIVETVASAHGWSMTITDGRRGGARFEFVGVSFD